MATAQYIDIKTSNGRYPIKVFDDQSIQGMVKGLPVNIFASGPSIADINFDATLLHNASMFVNGSLTLTAEHHFSNIVAYVISDARFIKHNAKVLEQFYTGQPLYVTKPVLDAIVNNLPQLITTYHKSITIIQPVVRPINTAQNSNVLKSIPLINKIVNRKLSLNDFKDHSDFEMDTTSYPKPIGVSLNIGKGFVEAGTVAFVAAQLAYSLGANQINLYGIDLINSNQPRFYEKQDNAAPCKLDKAITDRIVPSFDLMGRVYGLQGITVKNHSPVSKDLFKNV